VDCGFLSGLSYAFVMDFKCVLGEKKKKKKKKKKRTHAFVSLLFPSCL